MVHGLSLPGKNVDVVNRVHFFQRVVNFDERFLFGSFCALVDLGLHFLEELIILDIVGPDAAIQSVNLEFIKLTGLASKDRDLVLHDDQGLVPHERLEVLLDLYYICVIHLL